MPIDLTLGHVEADTDSNGTIMEFRWDARPGRSAVRLRYRSGALEPWLAEQVLRHLTRLVGRFGDGMDDIRSVRVIDDVEAGSIVTALSGPSRAYPLERPLSSLLDERASRTPDRTAVVVPGSNDTVRVTYEELSDRVSRAARALVERGVAPGERVAVLLERSVDYVVTFFAVLRAGGVCTPLEPSYPGAYLRRLISDARPRALVGASHPALAGIRETVPLVSPTELDVSGAVAEPSSSPRADEPCLLMYTSGSTGRPKGVLHAQRQIINRLHWMWEAYPFRAGDRIAQRSPVGVMPSVWEFMGGLLAGIPTVVLSERDTHDPVALAARLSEQAVSFVTLTPTLLRLLLDARARAETWPAHLRVVIVGGDRLEPELRARFAATFPESTLVDDFGATEANTMLHAAYGPSTPPVDRRGYRPISNVSALIVGPDGRAAPFGVEGELCVAGPAVALGYHGRSNTPNAAFAELSPDGTETRRVYRTADLGFATPDGKIHVTGRRAHQVKINGFRVELAEVERSLAAHPEVIEAV
ncbi:MAG: amino acid adenylation domain-containing protein, partial [Gemmatimonadetes bacterium]|nr:amino acid adenylation domain-containing protein [Gemmatimonadota bacterium]